MRQYRDNLPHLHGAPLASDGGLETTLIFLDGVELPAFASFVLINNEAGRERLRGYYLRYKDIAYAHGMGMLLETPTWRANADWGQKLGYDAAALAEVNRSSVQFLEAIRSANEQPSLPIVINGVLGPRGDGYKADARMSVDEARRYHSAQMTTFAESNADMATGYTMNYGEEAIGIALAARDHNIPVAISFTLETDGKLPSGDTLADAIRRTDSETGSYPAYYMINCAHPTHFEHVLRTGDVPLQRLRGLKANASQRSHAELDESTDLDAGNPKELAEQYRNLRTLVPQLAVFGGCCGTDYRHVEAICAALH